MPSINTSDVTRASDSTYYVDIARVKKLNTYLLTYFVKFSKFMFTTTSMLLSTTVCGYYASDHSLPQKLLAAT